MYHQSFNSIGSYIYNGFLYNGFEAAYNFHNSYELIYVFDGIINATVNKTDINVRAGEILLIAPNMIHKIEKTDKRLFIGVFSNDFVPNFGVQHIKNDFIKFTPSEKNAEYLKENMFFTGTPEFFMLKSCLYGICSSVALITNEVKKNTAKTSESFVFAVNNYISENLERDFTQKELAKELNYEYHYFSNLFHKIFKTGFKVYVNSFRFKKACTLLQTTNLKVIEIAYDCGFTSIRTFNKVFRELSGMSPREYKNAKSVIHELEDEHFPVLEYEKRKK